MEEKQLTEQEGLALIQQMISTAKKEQKDDGRGWIIWGWMLFMASVFTILNIRFHWFQVFFFWNLFGLATILIMVYESIRDFYFRKTEKVRTYTKDLFQKLNLGFFISLLFIIVSINVGVPPTFGFALLISLYAFWILIYGTALNFRPSVIASYITWGFGFVALAGKTFEVVMIFHSLAVLCGYIIPGYIANREFKKIHRKDKAKAGV